MNGEMSESGRRKRRIRRLALVGILGALAFLFGVSVLTSVFSAPTRPPRLPDLSAVQTASRTDQQLSFVMGAVAGRSALVRCWSHTDWNKRVADYARRWPRQVKLGPWSAYTAYEPLPTVHVAPEICIELGRLARLRVPVWRAYDRAALAWSVQALAHESAHVSGFLSEAAAECYGVQRIAAVAGRFGKAPREGRFLAELFWKRFYPFDRRAYRSDECRRGGALDLSPQTGSWP